MSLGLVDGTSSILPSFRPVLSSDNLASRIDLPFSNGTEIICSPPLTNKNIVLPFLTILPDSGFCKKTLPGGNETPNDVSAT